MPSAITVTFSPQSGPENTPVTVFLSETGGVVEAVKFNGKSAWFDDDGSGAIATRVPMMATTGKISVTISGVGAGTYFSTTNFQVTQPAALPSISSFSPSQGAVSTVITVTGSNLGGTTEATIGGAPALLKSVFANQVVIEVLNANSGPIRLSGSQGTAVSSGSFTVTNQSTSGPVINSFSPASGPKDTIVTIFGSGFSTVQEVTFGGVLASFTPGSNTQFTARVPADAATGKIGVRNASGTSFSALDFVVPNTLGAPTITSFSPGTGVHPDEITIFGQNLGSVSQVTFNNVLASFRPVNNTQLRATVPMDTATGRIRVTNPSGTATSSTDFVVPLANTAPKPRIDSFSPQSGEDGTDVVISGQFFTNVTEVRFAGLLAQFTPQGDGQLTARVPMDAQSGPISIKNPGGTTFSSVPFTVSGSGTLPPPAPGASGIKMGEAIDAGFEPTVDNEEAPSFRPSGDRKSGVLTLVSGQSKTISLIAERSDLRLEKVAIDLMPSEAGFFFEFPAVVDSFVPFNLVIRTDPTTIDKTYRFEVKGTGVGAGKAVYDPFILEVRVVAPVEVLLPTEIEVIPGGFKASGVKIIRRRFATPIIPYPDQVTSNYPPGVLAEFLSRGTVNNGPEDRGGKVDNFDLKVTAASDTPLGNFTIGVEISGATGVHVRFPSKKVRLKVVGVRVEIEFGSVNKTQARKTDSFEVTYSLRSFGYAGVVNVTGETPYYLEGMSPASGVRARMPQPAPITIEADENLSNLTLKYDVVRVDKPGNIVLPLAAQIPNAPVARNTMAKILLIAEEVVIEADGIPISVFGQEKRTIVLNLRRVPPFVDAFVVQSNSNTSHPSKINPIDAQVPVGKTVARFDITGDSTTNDSNAEYQFTPMIPNGRILGLIFPQLVYYRPTENYVQLSLISAPFPAIVELNVRSGLTTPVMAPNDKIRFELVITKNGMNLTSMFALSPASIVLTAATPSMSITIGKVVGMTYETGKYQLVARGEITGRACKFNASTAFEITGANSISPGIPVTPPIRTTFGSRTIPSSPEGDDSIVK